VLTRDQRLLDAAIEVLGAGGMRQLTHRAVDTAAGLPLGSTSNRFRTRESLLVGVLQRVLEREAVIWTRFAIGMRTTDVDEVAEALGALLVAMVEDERVLTRARRTVLVDAANQIVLRDEVARDLVELTSWMAPLLAELGSPDPDADVHHLLALLDGLVGNQLASGRDDFDPSTPIAALLRGLVER
jgi:AcrR family transcriptional regulator